MQAGEDTIDQPLGIDSWAGAMNRELALATHRKSWRPDSFLFQLGSGTLGNLISAGRMVEFHAGNTLITEGDTDTSVYLLLSSCVKVTARLGEVGEALLAVRFGGDLVGELAAVDARQRSATVRACGRTPVTASKLDRVDFIAILRDDPSGMLALSAYMSGKLRSATRRRVDYTGCPPAVRLARVLRELVETHGNGSTGAGLIIGVDLTQIELGTLVGVKRASAERALRDLRRAGLIDTGGKRLLVRDIGSLIRFAEQGT
ncbi:Crp/Fnr family transcriptional regulator [Actinophytocola glycyrrhizae]